MIFRRLRGLASMPNIPPPVPSPPQPSLWPLVSALDALDSPYPYPESPAPHCDAAVLHAPGECKYCDAYPAYQAYRTLARIAFTGHRPVNDEVSCPSEVRRKLRDIEAWGGNRRSS